MLSSPEPVIAALTGVLVSAWCIAPAAAQEGQQGESKPTYITFPLPGTLWLNALFVSRNLTVTGTYIGPNGQASFVRDSRGTITEIKPQGSQDTIVAGISADGTIAGWYLQLPTNHGFLRDPNGTITTVDVGISTIVYGINSSGSIVGTQPSQGFERDVSGSVTIFEVPGSTGTVPTSISQSGEIAGIWFDVNSKSHGFVRSPQGTIASFDPDPGVTGFNSLPSINRAGVVVGSYFTGSYLTGYVLHSFARSPQGAIIPIEVPGAGTTQANGINDSGTIVGSYSDANGQHGFARSAQGKITSFDVPQSSATAAISINNNGVIVGTYNDSATGALSVFLRLAGSESDDDARSGDN
jgi:hypothetical protein